MRVLVVNAGSSSLKLRALDGDDEVLADGGVEDWDGDPGHAGIAAFVSQLPPVDAVGHRVVHGGDRFRQPVVIDSGVVAALEALTPLAPLHQPRALAGMRAVGALLADRPAVACFDTAFHATMSPTRCRGSGSTASVSGATASTVSATPGRRSGPPSSSTAPLPTCGW